jgi:hypothetical protein
MIFQIRWTENYEQGYYTLFDIEVWKDVDSTVTALPYTEIKTITCVEGITRYLMSRKDDAEFNVEMFIEDAETIEELRRWVWEIAYYKIKGDNAHQEKVKHIKEVLKMFCEKYGCYLNED